MLQYTPRLTWSYTILEGIWYPEFDSIVNTANALQLSSINLNSSLTERFIVNQSLAFSVLGQIGIYNSSAQVSVVVEPFALATIGNYSKSYLFNASSGFQFYPTLTFP